MVRCSRDGGCHGLAADQRHGVVYKVGMPHEPVENGLGILTGTEWARRNSRSCLQAQRANNKGSWASRNGVFGGSVWLRVECV
jgi:hypothetical protein